MTTSFFRRNAALMIPRTASPWQRHLVEAVSCVDELLRLLDLGEEVLGQTEAARAAARQFPLRVPRGFVARMRIGDPLDPLLLQVLPMAAEEEEAAGFEPHPLAEGQAQEAPGLLHKYRGRVLLITTGACGIHCRYCFRRHFPYGETVPPHGGWQEALTYIRDRPEIEEVLLSGGDPLALNDRRLAELAGQLEEIPHLRRLRVHSRMPVIVPERVDDRLLSWLAGGRLRPVMVLHANHGREIDGEVAAAVGRLRAADITVLNQAVLLRRVNDRVEDLRQLSEALFEAGALPYYLHLLDRVQGAAHFEVSEEKGARLIAELARQLPGYLVPKLVREIPGAPAKTPIPMN
jgi:EF-P beta-lysylation protein EpmB